jgi:parallel beta-helix repeat protein
LSVRSDDDLLVQNNTVYDSACFGIMTAGAGNHTVRNNLVVQSYQHHSKRPLPELRHWGTGTLTLENNNLFTGSTGGNPVANLNGPGFSCRKVNGGSIGATNKCAAASFVNVSGRPLTWDLHLAASDTANRNAGAAQGPAVDIDGQPRNDGQIDIGADEIAGNDTTPPAPPQNLREVP